jgi:hypothetical protein
MKRLIVVLTAAICVAVPAPAAANGTLDQQTAVDTTSFIVLTGPTFCPDFCEPFSGAQTFTAGLSGALDRVDLYLSAFSGDASPLTVEIRNVASGLPGPSVLASASVAPSSISELGGWVEVDFATPAAVQSGGQYAIVAYASGSDRYRWSSASGSYSRGQWFITHSSPPDSSWLDAGGDSAFKTYVLSAAQAIADLQGLVTALDLPQGLTTALNSKLDEALAALAADDTAGACDSLQAFLNQVSAQNGKKLPGDQAQQLTDAANQIRATLGC